MKKMYSDEILEIATPESIFYYKDKLPEDGFVFVKVANEHVIEVTKNDSIEVVKNEIKKKSLYKAVKDSERTPRDIKARQNLIKRLQKTNDITEVTEVVKIIKGLIKFSMDEMFPARAIAKLLTEKGFSKDYRVSDFKNPENLKLLIIGQTIESLFKAGVIHPKIKLLINEVEKMEKGASVSKEEE